MNWWEVINSPIVLAILTLIAGSFIATWVTSIWQRRSQSHAVKLQYTKDIIIAYQDYVRILKGDRSRLEGEEFDEVHSSLVSLVKIVGIIFKDNEIEKNWKVVINRLINVRDLRLQRRAATLVERKFRGAFKRGEKAIERTVAGLS